MIRSIPSLRKENICVYDKAYKEKDNFANELVYLCQKKTKCKFSELFRQHACLHIYVSLGVCVFVDDQFLIPGMTTVT